MKSIRSQIIPLSFSVLIAFGLYGQDSQEAPAGYLFLGVEASAQSGKSFFPIVKMDKKKIHVDSGMSIKKVSPRARCRTGAKLTVSDRLVEVLEMGFSTSSMANMRRSSDAISDMQLAEAQADFQVNALLTGGQTPATAGPLGSQPSTVDEVRASNREFQDDVQRDIDDGEFEVGGLVDTVFLKSEFLPATDIAGAYCVVVVTYNKRDYNSGEYTGKGGIARAKFIGDLRKDELFKLKARISTSEFNQRGAEYQVYLYSEEGEPVALSNSRGLKPLNRADYNKFTNALN